MPSLVTVDARMLGRSGIGTYLGNVLPRLIDADSDTDFHLIGPENLLDHGWARRRHVSRSAADAPIYSVSEQLQLFRHTPRDTSLFWSPHYNVPLLHRGPVLTTVHDLAHLAVPGLVRARHRRAYARMMLSAAGRRGATIFVSRFTADEYTRLLGRPRGSAAVIHQGVDASWFNVTPQDPGHARPYLLFVGNVKPHKNLVVLLRAFWLLMAEMPHDLLIVGQREGFIHGHPDVERQAAALGSRVRFTGWLSEADVKQAVAGAEALVFPSVYEGFGLPPLEAMASGCPVLVSRAAAMPEVCGEAALYFDPTRPDSVADAVRRLLGDAVLRDEMVARGRERARLFTWERCASETAAVIKEAMSR